jgi:hypothetical protein
MTPRVLNKELKVSIAANLKPGDTAEPIIGEYAVVPAKVGRYSPDFVLWNGIVIEAKGYWRKEDQEKVRRVREQYPGLELRMVFEDASRRISKRSKVTYGGLCDRLGIRWAEGWIPNEWLEEPEVGTRWVAIGHFRDSVAKSTPYATAEAPEPKETAAHRAKNYAIGELNRVGGRPSGTIPGTGITQ